MAEGGFTCYQIFLAVGMLLTGSINTLSKKAQNQCFSDGIKDAKGVTYRQFDHPWFQTLIMFTGEALCLFGFIYSNRKQNKHIKLKVVIDQESSSTMQDDQPRQSRICQLILIIPTICDLVGTTLSGIGLLYVDASVWQMLRGSIIIFTGLFSKIFLKRELKLTHWLGILFAMCGLMLVGVSSIMKPHHTVSQWHTALGIILIITSQIVSATQMVLEETFVKGRGLQPFHVVGLEGIFGILFMSALVLPVLQHIPGDQPNNSYENSLDALTMLKNNYVLVIFCVVYLLSISFYNVFGLSVTKSMTAVHRTLLDACRTCVVWVCSLFLYYAVDKDYGEHFNEKYGLLQVDGFLLLLIGTAMYNQLLDFSWMCRKRTPLNAQNTDIQSADYREYDARVNEDPLLHGDD